MPLYLAFIDFKKAFDTIWRTGLIKKLQRRNLDSKFINIIADMYSDNKAAVKVTRNRRSEFFESTQGVKQGDGLSPTLFNIYVDDIIAILQEKDSAPATLNNILIGGMFYADDLVIMSNTEAGLQNSLHKLDRFCSKWKLVVNHDKSKIMVLNKSSKCNFKCNGNDLEKVRQYNYLGVVISTSGSYNSAMKRLATKARGALFRMREILYSNNIRSGSMHSSMFDLLVRPILTYASEIWAVNLIKKRNALTLDLECDRAPFEKIHIKFCKQLLWVNSKTCNILARGELGRYPVICDIITLAIKYFIRLKSMPESRTLHQIFTEVELGNITCNWWDNVSNTIAKLGINTNIDFNNTQEVNKLQKESVDAVYCHYQEHFFNTLHDASRSKLRNYKQFKTNYVYEPYLDIINSPYLRRDYTRLRLGAHNLAIESGRWKKIEASDRICPVCTNGVENEIHFLLECSSYIHQRKVLDNQIQQLLKNYQMLSKIDKFVLLLNASQPGVLVATAQYIHSCFEARKQLVHV